MDDSRIGVSKMPISPAGPTASDLRLSQSLEETLKSFNMFETDEGMQSRLLNYFRCFDSVAWLSLMAVAYKNPAICKGYSEDLWGLTCGDTENWSVKQKRRTLL